MLTFDSCWVCGPNAPRLLAFLCGCGCVWNQHVPHLPCMPFLFSDVLLTRRRLQSLILWSACQESTGGGRRGAAGWTGGGWDEVTPGSSHFLWLCSDAGSISGPHPPARHPGSSLEKQWESVKNCIFQERKLTFYDTLCCSYTSKTECNYKWGEGGSLIPFSLVWCVRFKLPVRQRPGWMGWLKRAEGLRGVAWHTNN